ncbi:MAG: hypothetical protein ABI239_01515 [Aquihabitans sp.]
MILLYLLIPALVVGIAASVLWLRNREPTSLESGVESFRREMQALSPEAAPEHRRRTEPAEPGDGSEHVRVERVVPRPAPPRHPPGRD